MKFHTGNITLKEDFYENKIAHVSTMIATILVLAGCPNVHEHKSNMYDTEKIQKMVSELERYTGEKFSIESTKQLEHGVIANLKIETDTNGLKGKTCMVESAPDWYGAERVNIDAEENSASARTTIHYEWEERWTDYFDLLYGQQCFEDTRTFIETSLEGLEDSKCKVWMKKSWNSCLTEFHYWDMIKDSATFKKYSQRNYCAYIIFYGPEEDYQLYYKSLKYDSLMDTDSIAGQVNYRVYFCDQENFNLFTEEDTLNESVKYDCSKVECMEF